MINVDYEGIQKVMSHITEFLCETENIDSIICEINNFVDENEEVDT